MFRERAYALCVSGNTLSFAKACSHCVPNRFESLERQT